MKRSPAKPAASPPVVAAQPFARRLVRCGTAIAVLGSAWLVDPYAEASFDAPKRTVVLVGVALAVLGLAGDSGRPDWRRWSLTARLIAASLGLVVAWLAVAALASPHAELAWTSLRRSLLFLLLIPIGASRAFDGSGARALFLFVALACASNALISLLQFAGLPLPFDVAQVGGRFKTGALLGNEGYVALACALLGAAGIAIALGGAARRTRGLGVALALVAIAAIAANRQATSALALLGGALVAVAVRFNARRIAALVLALFALVALSAAVPGLRAATWAHAPLGVEDYQHLTTYRLGAWAAALDMASSQPLHGYGPGSYAAEQQVHRFAAEIDLHARFVHPLGANFAYAHSDYLQLAAEAGWPALLFALAALAATLLGLLRLPHDASDSEPNVLAAVLATGAIAALAWFPMQIPLTAALLLLVAGRAWRLIAAEGAP